MQPVGSTDDLPQIPEPDGSYVLNQIFIIPIYKKARESVLVTRPTIRGSRIAHHC